MASTKLRKYNAIPRGDDKKAIDALTKIAETLTGSTGDKLEKALTLRDLEALDLITIQNGLNRQGGQFTNIIKVGETVKEADFPSKPVNFGAVGTYSNILISWDTPTYKGHSTTEIYRSDTNVLGEALFIASTISSLYGDPVGTNSSYYYWVRHVNINGDKGPYNDTLGVFAETAPDVDYLLEQLTNQINDSHLATELRNDIDWISKSDGLIERSISARSDIAYLGIDNSLIRDSIELSNIELLNLGDDILAIDAEFEVLEGEVNARATYAEVESAVARGIASLIPKYSFQFNVDADGFTGVTHNAGGWITSTAASPAVTPAISYTIEEYPVFRMRVRQAVGGAWNGEITVGSETIPVPAPSAEDIWEVITVTSSGTGGITSVSFDLGDADIDYVEIAKRGSNDLALEDLTARVTIAENNLNAIDGTYITGIITNWYDGGGVITSDVNTLIDSFNSTYSVSATLADINSNGTISKANTAQSWVSAADANIRDVVLAYNSEEGITNVSVDLDGLNGRITNQVFSIGGIEKNIYSTQQASLEQEYYLHLLRTGGETGNAKLALADSQLRAYVDENGNAVAQQITELVAISDNNLAGVSELKTALAYDDGAISISATDVYVTVEGVTQGIQEYAEVVAQEAVDGSPVTALWTVKSTIAGLTAGFGLYNDGVKTSFLVNSQQFSIISPIDNTATPLLTTIEGDPEIPDGVYIDTAYIQDAYVVNLVSATINADYINALDVDVAGRLRATGVDFNGGTFVVDTNGQVIAKNITIQDSLGNTILSSGGTVNIDYSGLSGLPTLGSLASQNSLAYSALTGTKPPTNADQTATALTKSIIESKSGLSTTNFSTYITAAYIKMLLVDQLIAANIYAENIEGDVVDSSVVEITSTITITASTTRTIFSVDIDYTNAFSRIFVLSGARVKHDNGSGPTSNFNAQLYLDGVLQKSYSYEDVTEALNEYITLSAFIPKTIGSGVHTVEFKIVTGSDDLVKIPPQSMFFNTFKEGSSYSNLVVYGGTTSVPGGGPTGPECVCEDMFLVEGLIAKDAKAGDSIDVANGSWLETGPIKSIKHGVTRPCIKMVSESGAIWKGSIDTPITRSDDSIFYPSDSLGELVHVCIDGVEFWEPIISAEDIGDLPIVHIYVGDISYAAGLEASKRIVTHNIYYKP